MTLIDPTGTRQVYDVLRGGYELPVLHTIGQVVELCGTRTDLYVRFSYTPDDRDVAARRERESGNLLPGVPAWPLCPESWWGAGARVWIARQLARRAHLAHAGAEPWLVAGEVRGRGPDCEPLIAQINPLARINQRVLAEAEEDYAAWQTRGFRALAG
ncbi:DUF6098 family protein [Georgenia sp. H159]|uniref:DUF6098 family protein n=1 Tax=Georgenia sp. H159 TaxID=3076115 RepID=UPI002D768659|nr:DUF6098 family protein [Georgenia sp. H159]